MSRIDDILDGLRDPTWKVPKVVINEPTWIIKKIEGEPYELTKEVVMISQYEEYIDICLEALCKDYPGEDFIKEKIG